MRLFLAVAAGLLALACSKSDAADAAATAATPDAAADAAPDAGDDVSADAEADVDTVDAEAGFDAGVLPPGDGVCLPGDASAGPAFAASYARVTGASGIQDKAFYLLTLLEADPALLATIAADATLSAAGAARDAALRSAATSCGADAACLADAVALSDADAKTLGDALVAALAGAGQLAPLATDHLRAAGNFHLHADLADDALLAAAWTDTAKALASALDGYVRGLDGAKAQAAVADVVAKHAAPMPFFQPIAEVIVAAMLADARDEAARYEPLADGENAKALARAKAIDWASYPYTVIVVPGEGPTKMGVALDPIGQKRCDIAITRWNAKLAPFLLTSGGHVHPDRTPYAEALEMKKYFMSAYGVPEDAILVDPHARHTTTNVRNATREVLRYGFPQDRKILITTDFGQNLYIGNHGDIFDPRCLNEHFYIPYRTMEKLGDYDTCILPSTLTLYASGLDPLDP